MKLCYFRFGGGGGHFISLNHNSPTSPPHTTTTHKTANRRDRGGRQRAPTEQNKAPSEGLPGREWVGKGGQAGPSEHRSRPQEPVSGQVCSGSLLPPPGDQPRSLQSSGDSPEDEEMRAGARCPGLDKRTKAPGSALGPPHVSARAGAKPAPGTAAGDSGACDHHAGLGLTGARRAAESAAAASSSSSSSSSLDKMAATGSAGRLGPPPARPRPPAPPLRPRPPPAPLPCSPAGAGGRLRQRRGAREAPCRQRRRRPWPGANGAGTREARRPEPASPRPPRPRAAPMA